MVPDPMAISENPSLFALSDGALVTLVAARDEGAFEAVVRRHQPALLRSCMAVLHNAHDAEEAVQGALLKAYLAMVRGVRPLALKAWLIAIARNECLDLIRRRPSTESLPAHLADPSSSPAERAEQREAFATLRGDLANLPEAQRSAIVLRGLMDLRHEDIARRIGVTPATARTLVHEARSSLAEFREGRTMSCSLVLSAIDTGDRRRLRARRVRAHLQACEECRGASARQPAAARGRLSGLLPAFPVFSWLRSLLGIGQSAGDVPGLIAGGAGIAVAVSASVAVILGGGSSAIADRATPGQTPAALAGGAGANPAGLRDGGVARLRGGAVVVPAARTTGSPGGGPPGAGTGAAAPATLAATPSASAPGVVETIASAGSAAAVGSVVRAAGSVVKDPSAAVPSVAVPSVAVPSVPSVAVPAAAVPPVVVPSVTVPSVAVPPVGASPPPDLPSLPVP